MAASEQSPATNGADDFSRLSMEEVGRKALEIRSCLVDIYGTPPLLLDALGKLENRFQELKALPSAIPTISAAGNYPLKFFGSPGPIGTCMGMEIHADPVIDWHTIEIRDSINGRLLGRIINVG